MTRKSGRALVIWARRGRSHQSDTRDPYLSRFNSNQDSYNGPDKLTSLPPEILLRIVSYFQPPGDEHWDDKSDLKAISLVNNTLADVVKDQLFRFMTLKYSYDFDRGMMQWRIPEPIRLMQTQPSLANVVKQATRAVRLLIVPMPENGNFDIDPECRSVLLSTWSAHLQCRLHPTHATAPCVLLSADSAISSRGTTSSQNAKFNRLFGAAERDDGRSVEETVETTGCGVANTREVFASYIFRTMHTLFS